MARIKYLVIPALLLSSLSAEAALVTDRWTATLDGVLNTTAYSVGDSISWTVTYDNTSTSMNYFDDGADGVGKTADDISHIAGTACPSCTYTLTANSSTNIEHMINQMITGIANYAASYDFYSLNYDRIYDQRTPLYTYNERVIDDIGFLADNYNGGSRNMLKLYYNQTNNSNYNMAWISWGQATITRNITAPTQSIPEPSVISIFGLGIVGISLLRRRKKLGATN